MARYCQPCQMTLTILMPGIEKCPKCGGELAEIATPEGQDIVRSDLTVVTAEEYQTHVNNALPLARELLNFIQAKAGTLPWENALALGLALIAICQPYGFVPSETIATLQDAVKMQVGTRPGPNAA